MKIQGLLYRIIWVTGISLTLGVGSLLAVFFGMVYYAQHKYPQHNSMAGIEAFAVGSLVGIGVFALSISVGMILIFVKNALDPNKPY